MTRRTKGILLLIILVGGVATVGAGVNTDYSVSTGTGVDVEPQTVTLEGTSYTFSQIGKTTSTSEFDVTASVPAGTNYSIYIYSNDEKIQDTKRMEGSGTATFDASSFDPGTYLVSINGPDGETQAVMPLVVTGYNTDLSTPGSVTPGENVTISVSVAGTDSDAESISSVSVVIMYEGNEREVTAERVADGEYEATISLKDSGEYDVYAGVHGQSKIDGEKQLVGISDQSTISVEEDSSDGTGDDTSDSNDGTDDTDNSDGDTTETVTVTETTTATTTETATKTATQTPTETVTETRTETGAGTETETAISSTATMTETSSGPITPGDDTPEPDPASVPLNGVQNLLMLLLLVSAAARLGGRQ